ncbi:MAG: chemotaxis protein CheW [Pirellulaceae bacterium]|nr:chemotaxis protein CheW [Pirellulaceae bacterium]
MSFEDAELLKEFVVESQEHLSDVENQLLTLESQGEAMDVSLVNTVFRAVHSIKGAAGFLGLDTLQGLAHREEEVLNKLRNNDLRPTSVVINTLLKATDRLKGLLDEIEDSNNQDVSEHLHALERILNGETAGEVAAEATLVAQAQSAAPVAIEGLSSEALREFLVESYDNLEQLERDLMSLERNSGASEIINSAFRNIHTIKGTAGFLGFSKLESVTHVAENLLGSIRSGKMELDSEISGGLFKMIDAVRSILSNIERHNTEGDDNIDALVADLIALGDDAPKQAKEAKVETKAKSKAAPKKRTTKTAAAPAPSESTSKPMQTAANPKIEVEANLTPAAPQPLRAAEVPKEPVPVQLAQSAPIKADSAAIVSKPAASPATTEQNLAASAQKAAKNDNDVSAADSTIRVDVALLDKLMTCVGELVLARNQILQFTNGKVESELHGTSQRLNIITTELQEGVMKTRMQPIGNVWSKFPRLVRDLAVICEKQVRIEMEGKETELDKTIIEAIKDPLTHLVRNTVDHGIERPEVRLEKGKPAEGCLTLRAYHEGGQVNIEICDDGAGLNFERIKAKAIERGLMTVEQISRMADRDVGNLIFLPGFSTAEKVSNVSGRGVGMDVVKTNIEKIGGTVDLQSQPGHGTTIKIKIPLTLAIIPALIVSNDGNRYAIPQVNLLELVRLDGDQVKNGIEWIQGSPVYRLRGRLLPLVYLREQLMTKADEAAEAEALNIVVLRADDRQFGLVVDRISDTEEIVVKPLSKQLKGVSVYSGTTIMGDGRVALILDVMGLAHASKVISGVRDRSVVEHLGRENANRSHLQSFLVLRVGENRRYALPLDQVTRLEKIDTSIVERADQQEVVQYRGEILPLIRLSECMGVSSLLENESLMDVVVYTEDSRSVGLVVDQIVDIVESELTNTRTTQRAGLVSSAVIHGHVTDLLDLPAVIRMVDPTFFQGCTAS